ncbi:MAG: sulfite exporter TauE/SafE family protein [Candidatus Thorarchaeota archaeon]|nr:MAG: sulfite exporter TauE/SafE family protein [Candidatus Thorarchaeota archaeon]
MLVELIVGILIFVVAFSMTLVGKGGGNFYVVILVFASIPIHEASTTGQFILFCASFAGMLVFQKTKAVFWKLAIPVGVLVALSAFMGGYLSYLFDEVTLKIIFTVFLVIAGLAMLVPYAPERSEPALRRSGHISLSTGSSEVSVDLRVVIPVTVLTGFFSGMIGVSGGSFLVPMLVLACGLPMKTAVTTATPLVATSALMGFSGHFFQGHFIPYLGLPLAVITVVGGVLGGKYALKSKPKHLKRLFALTNIVAALLILVNLLSTLPT